jgi:hypothetical protein
MSAKELGMLHTVNISQNLAASSSTVTYNHDIAGQLTEQLQRMVRQGQYFKIAGIDMGLQVSGASSTSSLAATVSGNLRYFQPTRGRCAAFRGAFKAMAEAMKVQGITMRDNMFYDFRVPLRDTSLYANAVPFANGASFNGVDELAMVKSAPNGVFSVHNESVQPSQLTATFSEGFGVFGNAGNDFVLNENQQGYQGNHMIADDEFEEIPFQLSFDNTTTQANASTLTWQWRPDPALYLAILAGQFELEITDCQIESSGADPQVALVVAYSVAGWKSIMGNPDRKRKSRSRKRTSSKKKR